MSLGTTSASGILHLQDGDNTTIFLGNSSYDDGVIQYYNGSVHLKTGSSNGDRLFQVSTAGSERLRIESNGDVEWNNVGTPTPGYNNSTVGMGFEPRNGTIFLSRADNLLIHANRNNDGRMINFSQGGVQKFNIGLKNSGADLAYNRGTAEVTERLRIHSVGRF